MKTFEDSSLYSDSDSPRTRSSMYSSSSFSQSSPPLSSTPTPTAAPTNKPQMPTRPKSRITSFSLNAQEFVPASTANYGHYPNGATNECHFAQPFENCTAGGFSSPFPFPINMSAPLSLLNAQAQNQLLLQHQQILQEKKQLLQRQQELAAATAAKQQLILSTTAAAKNPQDEIANSLKMFACLSACKGNECAQSPVDEVMQEFASNGYTTDEMNRFQQYQAATSMQMLANANMFHNSNYYENNMNPLNKFNHGINPNWNYNPQQFLTADNANVYNEIWRQNFIHLMRQAEIANAVAINMDYNRKTAAKPFKRSYFKKEIPLQTKRCVFCDNNKEPEAVVKSHAVRDSQGRVLCPKLRVYVCPICHASGDDAHTVKYCPQKPIITMEETMKAEAKGRVPHIGAYSAVAPKQTVHSK